MAHSSGEDFECNIGELGGVFKCPTQVVDISSAILVNWVGYLSGPLKCVGFEDPQLKVMNPDGSPNRFCEKFRPMPDVVRTVLVKILLHA